jgi:hypothetical protein
MVFWNYIFARDWLPGFRMAPFTEDVFKALECQAGRLAFSFDPFMLTEVRSGIGEELCKTVAKDGFVVRASSSGKDLKPRAEMPATVG